MLQLKTVVRFDKSCSLSLSFIRRLQRRMYVCEVCEEEKKKRRRMKQTKKCAEMILKQK